MCAAFNGSDIERIDRTDKAIDQKCRGGVYEMSIAVPTKRLEKKRNVRSASVKRRERKREPDTRGCSFAREFEETEGRPGGG